MSNHSKRGRRLIKQGKQPPASDLNLLAATLKFGPLPASGELEKYEVLYPGATKLLFDNFANQSNHRMELEKLVIQEDNKRATIGQRNSFIITLTILFLAAVLFILGKDGPAISTVFVSLAPIIIAFISSSISRKKERNNKRRELEV